MSHPYSELPSMAFWKQAVSERNPLELADIYAPRFGITEKTRISAGGSCFAQHIGRQFKARGYSFVDLERPPSLLPKRHWGKFGYDMYSARYGNIYSARQLLQTFRRARGEMVPRDDYWRSGLKFIDPYRPTIEPAGYDSLEEMHTHRSSHLSAVDKLLAHSDLYVFTFGLTEAWQAVVDGAVYPTCPGTVHGTFDPQEHEFVNFGFADVLSDFEEFIALARRINPAIKFLITVSPVPLTATASGQHVLPATIASKSILRAVCAELYLRYDFVDYFPSYELVASHPMRALAYEPNLRAVSSAGVASVMDTFFAAHAALDSRHVHRDYSTDRAGAPATAVESEDEADVVCDEVFLEAFGA